MAAATASLTGSAVPRELLAQERVETFGDLPLAIVTVVQVDQRGPGGGVSHPRHQLAQGRARSRRQIITGGELALTDETVAYQWADEHALRELAAEAYAIRVLDALRADATPAVRHHDGTHLL